MKDNQTLYIHVAGPRACFTQPHLKVERVTFPVMTPAAAAGILKSIYWKPECGYSIDEIIVLNEIKTASIRRNELTVKASERIMRQYMTGAAEKGNIQREDFATQRTTVYLTDVEYVIVTRLVSKMPDSEPVHAQIKDIEKHRNMFMRRLQKGQYFHAPALGIREFSARCRLLEDPSDIPASFYAGKDVDLGYIQHHTNYPDAPYYATHLEAYAPVYWHAKMKDGHIDCSIEGVEVL